MKLVLTTMLCIAPSLVTGQGWDLIGLPKGKMGRHVIASDTVQVMSSEGLLYRQGADRTWRRMMDVPMYSTYGAWGDTIVALTPEYMRTTDAGMTWERAELPRGYVVMPHSPYVVRVERSAVQGTDVTVCNPLHDRCVTKNLPDLDGYRSPILDDGVIALPLVDDESIHLTILTLPSMDTSEWQRDDRVVPRFLIEVPGGGLAYRVDTTIVFVSKHGESTLHVRRDMMPSNNTYQVTRSQDWWLLMTRRAQVSTLYRSSNGKDWEAIATGTAIKDAQMFGVQGDDLVLSMPDVGPHRLTLSRSVISRDAFGLGHRGELFTDGRYVVSYDIRSRSGMLTILEDTPLGSRVVVDTLLSSMVSNVFLIGDSAWVVADSVYSVDLMTKVWSNEGFKPSSGESYSSIAALPGGIGILHLGRIYFRPSGDTTWERIDTNRTKSISSDALIGTEDGYLVVESEGWNIDLEILHSVRYTMAGDLVGTPGFIGDQYYWLSAGRRSYRRFGDTYYFTIGHCVGPFSTDVGASWKSTRQLGITPAALWWFDPIATRSETAEFSTNLGESWNRISIPDVAPYEIDQLFCLDHHCYAMGVDGMMTIPRPTVGVQEPSEKHQQRLEGESAVVCNVLGEVVATLPIMDGVLAPYEMSMLPMQPLWAVAGGVAIRIR